jgi:hypothetical protein|uniref:DUF2497 domain-containing protein n=1 Tax=Desulfobacca acetoxidans TaxID=60893 RepID=A0A7C3Z9H4_9BACT
MNLFHQNRPSSSFSPETEDDVIELTEVAEDPAAEAPDTDAEVVLDLHAGGDTPASLKSTPEPPPTAPREETLDDFLASLPDLREDLDLAPETGPPQGQTAPELPRELLGRLSDAELRDMVRQVVQETVERLARELFPQMAAEAIDRELTLWKKRLTEPD